MITARDVVVAEHLTMRFGDRVALDDISLTVRSRDLFGIIGPDGAGKSTLLRILATLLVPDRGTAMVLGVDAVRGLWDLRQRIGYMPGRFSLYPDLSVAENLDFFASVFGTTVEREYDQIAPIYSQLEPFRDRRAGALSGGMKQKLALCCALVHRPELLLLDEPTTGVDAVSRREFWDLLSRIQSESLTIVVSTPYMDEANRCDRIALVQHGRLLGVDTPEAIRRSFDRPLLAIRAPDRYRLIEALRGYEHAGSAFPFGDVLHFTDKRQDHPGEAVLADVAEFTAPTIEDVFIARRGTPEAVGETAP
jgi:ABC-2 type transport system ATP-binding protein